jgi:hypothetical protein
MKVKSSLFTEFARFICPVILMLFISTVNCCFAQNATLSNVKAMPDLKQTDSRQHMFTENIGQYGKVIESYPGMGSIKFGYEGLNMPVLFTPKGLIHLQRKIEKLSEREEKKLKQQGVPEDIIEKKKSVTDKVITGM